MVNRVMEKKQQSDTSLPALEIYKLFIQSWEDGITITDTSNTIIETNKSFADLMGDTPENIAGTSLSYWIDLLCPAFSKKWKSLGTRILQGKKIDTLEFSFKNRFFDITAELVQNNTCKNIFWLFRDTTEKNLARQNLKSEKKLQKSQEQLRQAQKMESLGTLVAGVAHEINNPVSLIIYNIPLFKKLWLDFKPVIANHAAKNKMEKYGGLTYDFLDKNLMQMLSDTDMASNRISRIVAELKDFSKQSDAADKKSIQLNKAVENALRLAKATVEKSNVELELALDKNIPLMNGNLRSLEHIILNILINAIQAIKKEQGKIKIISGYNKAKGKIFVSISDNGRGINPEISHKLFEPFVTDKQTEGGTGLGLSVAYSLVKAHDGNITFTTDDKGTTFTIDFSTIIKEKKAKILIVDDDSSIREILTDALTRDASYNVDQASNGVEACIKMGANNPDLMILDIFMPDMDGLEVCRAIKADVKLSGAKVIITTGYPNHQKLQDVRKLGFNDIFYKPYNLKEFLHKVKKIISV